MSMNNHILRQRRKVLGASETPTILGYGKYAGATPDSVYWSKVGPEIEDAGTDAQAMGNDLEPALVQYAQRRLGVAFETDPESCFQIMLDGIGKGILAATPDGILLNGNKRWGLEAKAVMYGNPGIEQWGDVDGVADKVPDNVIIQTQQQMAVWNLELVWIPVLWCVGFRPEFRMYSVKRDQDFFDTLIAPKAVAWWNDHIPTQIPPGNEPPPLDVIKRLERQQGLCVPANAETQALIVAWDECRKNRIAVEKNEEVAIREVLSRLGGYLQCSKCGAVFQPDHEAPLLCESCGGECVPVSPEGFTMLDGRKFTYKEQNGQRRCDFDGLAEQYPDAYKKFVTQPKHRTPRLTGKATVLQTGE